MLKVSDAKEMRVPLVKSPHIQTDCVSTSSNSLPFFSQNYIMRQDGTNGTYLRFHFYNDVPDMSLIVSGAKNINGGKISVKLNGTEAVILDCYANDSTVYEAETVISEQLPLGFHTLEFLSSAITTGQTAQTVALIYLTELIFRPNKTEGKGLYTLASTASLPDVEVFKKVSEGKIRYKNNNTPSAATGYLFTDKRAELKPNETLIIEVESKFYNGCGITWFGNPANNGNGSRFCKWNSGYLVSLVSSRIDLYNFGNNNAFGTAIATYNGTTTFDLNKKLLRIEHAYDGLIKVYLDGVKVIETTNTKATSGVFGIYAYNGGTLEIDRYEYTYK